MNTVSAEIRHPAQWTDGELDDVILQLCDEFPDASMIACSRALEFCREHVPAGERQSLVLAMRESLQRSVGSNAARAA